MEYNNICGAIIKSIAFHFFILCQSYNLGQRAEGEKFGLTIIPNFDFAGEVNALMCWWPCWYLPIS